MIEINGIWIFSLVALILSFLAIVFIAKLTTNEFDGINFSFMRVFPSEVIENSKNKIFYEILIYLFSIFSFSPIFVLVSIGHSTFQLLYVPASLFALASICFVFLHFFNPSHVKVHLTLFVVFSCLTFLGAIISGFGSIILINFYKPSTDIHRIKCQIKAGISFLFAIIELIALLNPKLRNWAKLEKVEGTDNQFVRPKKFPLAYTEWLTLVIMVLSEITLLSEFVR